MQVLLINEIAGQIDRLRAVLERARAAQVDAVFVLGNSMPDARCRPAAATPAPDTANLAPSRPHPSACEDALAQAHATHTLHVLGTLGVPVLLVPGERDGLLVGPDQIRAITQEPGGLRLLHRQAAHLGDGTIVLGFAGVPTTALIPHGLLLLLPSKESYTAFEYRAIFHPFFRGDARRIVLFATVPCAARPDSAGAGIVAFTHMLQTYRPQLICCGGLEQNGGMTVIDGTPMVTPGTLASGSYALINLDRRTVRLERLPDTRPEERMKLRSIVVILDGSAVGWRALAWGAVLARRFCARLTLVYVFAPAPPGDPDPARTIQERVAPGERLLAQAAHTVADLQPHYALFAGPAAAAIVRAAALYGADLIVLGTGGRGADHIQPGSVSRWVVRHAPCMVLVVKMAPAAALVERYVVRQGA